MMKDEETEFYEKQFPEYMKERGAPGETLPADHFNLNEKEAGRRLRYLKGYLEKPFDIMEIGSSTGFFVHKIRSFVSSITGVEPGELYRGFANKKDLKTCSCLKDIEGKKFDIVFSFYVFEHIREPESFLKEVKKYLKPGGLVIFEVPNVDDILVSFYGIQEFLHFYWQKAHCFYYSGETLKKIFERSGLKTIELIYSQRYDISNHIHWLKEKKPGGLGAYIDIFDENVNSAYKRCLVKKGISDTVTIVSRNE